MKKKPFLFIYFFLMLSSVHSFVVHIGLAVGKEERKNLPEREREWVSFLTRTAGGVPGFSVFSASAFGIIAPDFWIPKAYYVLLKVPGRMEKNGRDRKWSGGIVSGFIAVLYKHVYF